MCPCVKERELSVAVVDEYEVCVCVCVRARTRFARNSHKDSVRIATFEARQSIQLRKPSSTSLHLISPGLIHIVSISKHGA